MKRLVLASLLGAPLALLTCGTQAAEKVNVSVQHDLSIARPSETIAIAWKDVNAALPGAMIQKIAVKDARGRVLPHQVTNIAPQAKDPNNEGIAYGELLFQHSFAAGEKSASFTIERIDGVAPPFPVKAFARHVPERLDDFAWENDKVAHRTYGPALAAPAPAGVVKEVLVTSGLDLWFKRVDYPIVDRWYNKGHDHYHKDQGEGMDMYNVGKSRGAGGSGIWIGETLHTGVNWASYKILANGPIRAVFELHYAPWDAGGRQVSEVKRFTVDAGHWLDRIDSTFTFSGPATLDAAVGLHKNPSDKGQEVKVDFAQNKADGSLVQWVTQRSFGDFGVAVIVPSASGFAADARNGLVTAPVTSGQPLRYYVGAAWTRGSPFATQAQWQQQVADEALRLRSPVSVSLAAGR